MWWESSQPWFACPLAADRRGTMVALGRRGMIEMSGYVALADSGVEEGVRIEVLFFNSSPKNVALRYDLVRRLTSLCSCRDS